MSYDERSTSLRKTFPIRDIVARLLHSALHVRDVCRSVPRLCIRPFFNLSNRISATDFLREQCAVHHLPYNTIYRAKKALSTLKCYMIPTRLQVTFPFPTVCWCGTDSPCTISAVRVQIS
ncbi:hypothetical protein AVEN_153981-1 [Araneus ventricosus]|uniref:Uncharacterized protein n=1 Tax=Araneus ventricosus TaxID=182803 RepID=A0A4Y2ITV8_ARAVE|nr:hypothetical protein AVEN_153981-1 [Araneus ventricosus]